MSIQIQFFSAVFSSVELLEQILLFRYYNVFNKKKQLMMVKMTRKKSDLGKKVLSLLLYVSLVEDACLNILHSFG